MEYVLLLEKREAAYPGGFRTVHFYKYDSRDLFKNVGKLVKKGIPLHSRGFDGHGQESFGSTPQTPTTEVLDTPLDSSVILLVHLIA